MFTSLNNGDIKTQFKTKEEYISKIANNEILSYDMLNNIISIPKSNNKDGINLIIFQKIILSLKSF